MAEEFTVGTSKRCSDEAKHSGGLFHCGCNVLVELQLLVYDDT